jgi:transposase-like protein
MAKIRRTLSPELKAKIVLELISGTTPQSQIARRYRVHETQLIQWRKQFLERLPTLFGAEPVSDRTQSKHVEQLERVLGQKTLEIELLKKASQWLIGPSTGSGSSS